MMKFQFVKLTLEHLKGGSCLHIKSCLAFFLSATMLISCAPEIEDSSTPRMLYPITRVATTVPLFVPEECVGFGNGIENNLKLEEYRAEYRLNVLEALSALTICLHENSYYEHAGDIGLETLLLSRVVKDKPKDIDRVAQIVSDADQHSYAMRAWADYTIIEEELKYLAEIEDLSQASSSLRRILTEMSAESKNAYGRYFDTLKDFNND